MAKNDFQQMKSTIRIEDVIDGYLHLQRNGKNYTGLCPFHPDHHPSLTVNPEKQTFSCFACGEHGDVFEFVRKMEHCTLGDAVRKLTGNGLAGDKLDGNKPYNRTPGVGRLAIRQQVNQPAKDFEAFLKLLLPYACGCSELSAAYLDFEVGMSPVQVPAEWKGMRNRIVFPIRDEDGKLVGMGARRLCDDDSSVPKYINSSVADGYDKGATLYGLNRAAAVIRKEDYVFVTEGYKDAIAMHAAGFVNTVALCGTALTDRHIALLKKYTNRACLLLDGDEAGQAASKKAVLRLREVGMDTDSALIPDGGDPDSLFRSLGREDFARVIGRLQNRPHSSECALLTVCLLYPEVTFRLKGEEYRFIDLVASALETDDLWFEDADHQPIFCHLQEAGTENGLPDSLRCIASELHREYDAPLQADLELLSSDVYLPYLLFLYSEARLLRLISRLVRRVVQEDHEELQHELVIKLAERREQLRHVSVWLDRPGAV